MMNETSPISLMEKLEDMYMSKSITNKLCLKKQLYGLKIKDETSLIAHLNEFNKLVTQLESIGEKIKEEDRAIILINYLSRFYEAVVTPLARSLQRPYSYSPSKSSKPILLLCLHVHSSLKHTLLVAKGFGGAAVTCISIPMASRFADSMLLLSGQCERPIASHRISAHYSSGICQLKWGRHLMKDIKYKNGFVAVRRTNGVKAVAVPVAPSLIEDTEYRKQLADRYGFRQIGEPLPENVTLKEVINTLPKKVFEIDDTKAWGSVLVSVTSYALGIFMISKAPWYLLPVAWAWTGTAITGFFVIGHDCAHKSFSKNKLVEDVVGTLAFLPLIYPYEPWRFKHDRHHAKTNMLAEDTAWHPVWKDEFDSSPLLRKAIIYGYGPFRPWMSIGHWLVWHFNLKKFRPNEVERVKISLACVFAFMAVGWPLIILKTGFMGWIKYWLMPWLGYHFWMSTFTMVHHTAPHIPFKYSNEWNAAQAQLNGTVHCDYPRWIEILCHDINVHIPHHISARIPSYNLRAAHRSLQENWGKYLNEATWNWRLMKTIMTTCHVYDKEENYIAFDELAPEESEPVTFLKRVMPDYA